MVDETQALYHEQEYRIARDRQHPCHFMPEIIGTMHSVLDVGCGAGQTLAALGEDYPHLSKLVGIDIDKAALTWGSRRWPGLNLYQGCGESMKENSLSYDLVICRVAMPYMDIPKALDEMVRVLKPGGHLWIVTHTWRFVLSHFWGSLRLGKVKHVVFMAYTFLNGLGFAMTGRLFRFPKGHKLESFQTESRMTRMLLERGLQEVTYTDRGSCGVVTARKMG